MKQMVKGLHKNNIRVIMDVVYNHVHNAANHSFNKTVPGYYFRYDDNGSLVNDSGCGNDTASERAMMRKYIVDSVTYWAKNYNIDGFRFDLMGLIDTKTMQEVRAALDKIDPSIIVLGEGWDMNSTMDKSEMTIQPNAYQVASDGTNNGIAFFNDSIRDGLKGSVFSDTDTGFVSGKADQGKPHRPQRARLPVRRRRHHHLLERQCAGPLRGCRSGGELRRDPRQHDPVRQAQEVRAHG